MPSQQQPHDDIDSGLAAWENEGGALASDRPEIIECEGDILQRLGAGVVALWKNLPADVQRRLFSCATSFGSPGEKELTARLLHAASSEGASLAVTRPPVFGAILCKTAGMRSEYVRFGSARSSCARP